MSAASARGSGGKLRVMLRDAVGDFLNGDAQMLLRDDKNGTKVWEIAPIDAFCYLLRALLEDDNWRWRG